MPSSTLNITIQLLVQIIAVIIRQQISDHRIHFTCCNFTCLTSIEGAFCVAKYVASFVVVVVVVVVVALIGRGVYVAVQSVEYNSVAAVVGFRYF